MKFIKTKALFLVIFILYAVALFANIPTTTRANSISQRNTRTVIHTFTATTGLDSIFILDASANAFETSDLGPNNTVYSINFQTAETTASQSDFDVVWQVSGQTDADADANIGAIALSEGDWVTVETDQNDNSISWNATFDAVNYRGMKVRAVLSEANADSDAAVAIEVSINYPRR